MLFIIRPFNCKLAAEVSDKCGKRKAELKTVTNYACLQDIVMTLIQMFTESKDQSVTRAINSLLVLLKILQIKSAMVILKHEMLSIQ